MLRLKKSWPFIETAGVGRAREQYNETVQQRGRVKSLSDELIERGRANHFAEQWEEVLRKGHHDTP